MVYLQGGPGKSGTFGQFLEVGPLGVNSEGKLYRRQHTVQKMFNVIFLDQPAGSGFSFTKSEMGYARSIDDCVTGAREFLRQFLLLFPENRNRELYVAGESYGSRGAVALSYSLMKNPDPGIPLKVSGVIAASAVFGNALELLDSADTLYHFGMLDTHGRDVFIQTMDRVRHLWAKNRTTALNILSHTIFRLYHTPSLFMNLTGYNDHASLFSDRKPREYVHYFRYMKKPLLKRALHLSSHATVDSTRLLVMLHLSSDYVTDLRDKVEYLLDATRMLILTGQIDTVFATVNQEKYLMTLNWAGASELRESARRPWYVDGPGSKLTGYVKTAKDLTYVVLTRAGHHVIADASEAAYIVIERFASGVDVVDAKRKVLGVNERR
nr:venom serine carboxypeptidase-like [Rhipicephalus microplus]